MAVGPAIVVKPATPSGITLFYIWADHLGTPRQIQLAVRFQF